MEPWRVKAAAVDPIRKREDIDRLRDHFLKKYKHGQVYALIVTLGCNFGLRAGDLLGLKVGDLREKTHLEIVEQKTGKMRRIFINGRCRAALDNFINQFIFITDSTNIFMAQKGFTLSVKSLHRIIDRGCKALGLVGNFGSHTLRKTFAFHAHKYTRDVFTVGRLLQHSAIHVTKSYVEYNSETEEKFKRSEDEVYSALNL